MMVPADEGGSAAKSLEYMTFAKCTPKLISAVKDHIIVLCGHLIAEELIDEDTENSLTDGSPGREAALIRVIRKKVQLDAKTYWKFIAILKNLIATFREIVTLLEETYRCSKPTSKYVGNFTRTAPTVVGRVPYTGKF